MWLTFRLYGGGKVEGGVKLSSQSQKEPSGRTAGFFCCHIITTFNPSAILTRDVLVANSKRDGLIKKLLIYKGAYPSSVIFSLSPRDISKRVPYAVSTIKRDLNLFLEKGWARWEGSRIRLISKQELHNLYSTSSRNKGQIIKIDLNRDILFQAYAKVFETHINRIAFTKSRSIARMKKAQRLLYNMFRGDYHQISAIAWARVFGCSKSKANLITTKLKKAGFIRKKTPVKLFISFCSAHKWEKRNEWWCYEDISISSCYFYRGKIYSQESSKYKILPIGPIKKHPQF